MSNLIEVTIPDIGGHAGVDVIEVFVKVGDTIKVDDAIVTLDAEGALGVVKQGLGYNPTFLYPRRGGIGQLPSALAARGIALAAGKPVVGVTTLTVSAAFRLVCSIRKPSTHGTRNTKIMSHFAALLKLTLMKPRSLAGASSTRCSVSSQEEELSSYVP